MTNDKLRGVFEALGLEQVSSVLSSGNILFHSPRTDVAALGTKIETALTDQLGIKSGTIIRSLSQLQALLDSDPFTGLTHGTGSYLTATFLKDAAGSPALPPPEDPWTRMVGYDEAAGVVLAVVDNSEPGGTQNFMAWLGSSFDKQITARTWLTVQRIARKLEK